MSCRRAATMAPMPPVSSTGAIDTIGLEGQITMRSAVAKASATPGAASADSTPAKRTARTGTSWWRPTKYSWNPTSRCPVGVDHDYPGLDALVAHGQDPDGHVPAASDLVGDRRQRRPFRQPGGAVEVGADIAIPQAEPTESPLAVGPQFAHGRPGLTDQAPPGVRVDHPGEGVGDRVEVGADVQSMHQRVVTGVHDGGDPGRIGYRRQAAEHPGCAHSAGQRHDHGAHGRRRRPGGPAKTSWTARRRRRTRSWPASAVSRPYLVNSIRRHLLVRDAGFFTGPNVDTLPRAWSPSP